MNGYDANAYWSVADLLPPMDAWHVDRRVVIDRNRMTAGGVTAGIDFALPLVARMKYEELLAAGAPTIEYAPQPPFENGSPSEDGPEHTAEIRNSRKLMPNQTRLAAQAAAKRLRVAGV